MRERLGQHFLKDKRKIRQVVDVLDLKDGDTVVEIGPGTGALTEEILRQAELTTSEVVTKKKGVAYVGIEKDENFIPLLEQLTTSEVVTSKIIQGDVRVVLPKLINHKSGSYKLVGNIPYYLTGELLRIIGDLKPLPERTILTVQKEVAERVTAHPPKMNILAASVQFWAKPKIIANISRGAFSPPPDVDSAVLLLFPHPIPAPALKEQYYELIHNLFRYPRKTIRNNISKTVLNISGEHLKKAGIDPGARPQNLSRGDILNLAEMIEL